VPREIKKIGLSYDATLSHEHLHLIQYEVFQGRPGSYVEPDFSSRVSCCVKPNFVNDELALYYLSLNEVEPRLHELVLSFVRQYGYLPLNYNGYLTMLISLEGVGEGFSELLSAHGEEFVKEVPGYYRLRDSYALDDLGLVFKLFLNVELVRRFFCEVLSVVYGNLLIIYSGTDAAYDYLKTIKNCELYGELYGPKCSPYNLPLTEV
jgi:hypothetical protein